LSFSKSKFRIIWANVSVDGSKILKKGRLPFEVDTGLQIYERMAVGYWQQAVSCQQLAANCQKLIY